MAEEGMKRMDRHSGDPKSSVTGNSKKDGGGGKFTAGKPGDEMEVDPIDKNDPNYDSEGEGDNFTKSQKTFFDKVVRGEIEIAAVYEDSQVIAVEEQHNPQAPTHILIFPKDRLNRLKNATDAHKQLLGHLMVAVGKVCRQQNLTDYRLVINDGSGAGQTVGYLHAHILAGRAMSWPPG